MLSMDCEAEKVYRIDIYAIRNRLLCQLHSALIHLLPNGKVRNSQFYVGNIKGDYGESLKVELEGQKAGLWQDFATGEGGDIFDLWAKVKGLDVKREFPALIEEIEVWLGSGNKVYHHKASANYSYKWNYVDKDGNTIAVVFRYDVENGVKRFSMWDEKMQRYRAPDVRPLYNIQGIAKSDRVILVEGEKCAQALIDKGVCATTLMGGANTPLNKTDWSPLNEKEVVIWPDNDEVGKAYGDRVTEFLKSKSVKSISVLKIDYKPEKWDAADAVEEGVDVEMFINKSNRKIVVKNSGIVAYGGKEIWNDNSFFPADIIYPSILPPEGLLVLGGAPKVGKTDFLMTWMVHMAAGSPFLGMKPAKPLKVFYLQAELSYNAFRKRLQAIHLSPEEKLIAEENFAMTPKLTMQLNEAGVELAYQTIYKYFKNDVDIIVIDPLRNFFDIGDGNVSENDNLGMLSFLQNRVELLRNRLNPKAGIILVHHTRKITKSVFEEDVFQALAGASALRGYYTSGVMIYRPNEELKERQVAFELREGAEIPRLTIEQVGGGWRETESESRRVIQQKHGEKLDAERIRKRDVILELIDNSAAQGKVYTMKQFCEKFENKAGLGGQQSIRARLDVLATKGYIKFFKDVEKYQGLAKPSGTKFGYMCVKNMHLKTEKGEEVLVYPTDYKCSQTGAPLPVENPKIWLCLEELCVFI